MTRAALGLTWVALVAACGEDTGPPVSDAAAVIPGRGIGPVTLGMSWAEVREALGAPPTEPSVLVRVGLATWPDRGLEALLTSPADDRLTDDAIVIGVGAQRHAAVDGIELDALDRDEVQAAFGPAPEEYGGHAYYPVGLAVEYGDDDHVDKVAVLAAYQLAPDPPPMTPAGGAP